MAPSCGLGPRQLLLNGAAYDVAPDQRNISLAEFIRCCTPFKVRYPTLIPSRWGMLRSSGDCAWLCAAQVTALLYTHTQTHSAVQAWAARCRRLPAAADAAPTLPPPGPQSVKVACGEGGCGACTVALVEERDGENWLTVKSLPRAASRSRTPLRLVLVPAADVPRGTSVGATDDACSCGVRQPWATTCHAYTR